MAAAAAFLALAAALPAHAQQNTYPSRPLRVVVFLPPGGAADVLARVMALKLGDLLGQIVVVDNRPGAGGVIGTSVVAKAAPDGHTILHSGITTHGIGPHIYTSLPYDPVKDFAPIILSATMPVFMMAHTQTPVKTVSEAVAFAKSKPNAVSWGSPGTGSAPHMVGELFKVVTGIPSAHIPYKGSGGGAPAFAAGEVQLFFDAVAGHQAFIKSGRVRALAVTSAARVAAYPDVPTMKEAGFGRVEGSVWYGFQAPAGTPQPIIARLNAESNRVLAMPEVKEKLLAVSIETAGGSPEAFAKFIRAELDRWGPVVKAAGVKVN
ncbi:MAG: tripartite tricarboxylate transporter substrate binding protein [Betaproteobacteria bacterium]|nr:tripartite tricarboxylate transporter substrate binding protein [Betaproteobacteria bacterium]